MFIDSISIAKYMRQIDERERRQAIKRRTLTTSAETSDIFSDEQSLVSRARAIFERARQAGDTRTAETTLIGG